MKFRSYVFRLLNFHVIDSMVKDCRVDPTTTDQGLIMKLPDKHLRGMQCLWVLLRPIYTRLRQTRWNPTIRANPRHYKALAPGEASWTHNQTFRQSYRPQNGGFCNPRTFDPEVPGSSPGPGAKSWPIKATPQGVASGFLTLVHAGTFRLGCSG